MFGEWLVCFVDYDQVVVCGCDDLFDVGIVVQCVGWVVWVCEIDDCWLVFGDCCEYCVDVECQVGLQWYVDEFELCEFC